jgi:hypothetical protein
MMLTEMFNDPASLVWIYFLESQMKVCSISVNKIQSDSISGSEVAVELDILSFYNTFLLYLEKWSNNILPLNMCHWTLLNNPPTWEKILHSTKRIADVDFRR